MNPDNAAGNNSATFASVDLTAAGSDLFVCEDFAFDFFNSTGVSFSPYVVGMEYKMEAFFSSAPGVVADRVHGFAYAEQVWSTSLSTNVFGNSSFTFVPSDTYSFEYLRGFAVNYGITASGVPTTFRGECCSAVHTVSWRPRTLYTLLYLHTYVCICICMYTLHTFPHSCHN